ncbi:histidine-rich glycoprotein-like [Limulus polyphemus]|uniref:Histidine-rich glycoprotein-like n=1 Tax=Limulus polyphemus TaxID=6850 RepID=A0ABM1BPC4_LIMPO|nr:histidine-rich glycoprotein-like [Limulus polyphemus]
MKVSLTILLGLTVLAITADASKLRDDHHHKAHNHEKHDKFLYRKHLFLEKAEKKHRAHKIHGPHHHSHIKDAKLVHNHAPHFLTPHEARLQSHLSADTNINRNRMDTWANKDLHLQHLTFEGSHNINPKEHHQHGKALADHLKSEKVVSHHGSIQGIHNKDHQQHHHGNNNQHHLDNLHHRSNRPHVHSNSHHGHHVNLHTPSNTEQRHHPTHSNYHNKPHLYSHELTAGHQKMSWGKKAHRNKPRNLKKAFEKKKALKTYTKLKKPFA